MRRVSTPVSASSSATTGPRVWPSNGLPCSALACSTNWPPFGLVAGVATDTPAFAGAGSAAELVRRPGFAFADAFDLGGVQRIDLGAALPVILETNPYRQGKQVGKALLERLIAGDLAPDVADHAAQAGAQELELAPGPLELMRVRVAPDHDRSAFGEAPVALPQWHVVAPRQIDQFFERAMAQPRIGRMRDRFRLHRGIDHDPFEIAGRQRAGLVRHRQALLDQRHQRLLAQPLAPMRQ